MGISMALDLLAERFCRNTRRLQRGSERLKVVRLSTLAGKIELPVQPHLFQQRGDVFRPESLTILAPNVLRHDPRRSYDSRLVRSCELADYTNCSGEVNYKSAAWTALTAVAAHVSLILQQQGVLMFAGLFEAAADHLHQFLVACDRRFDLSCAERDNIIHGGAKIFHKLLLTRTFFFRRGLGRAVHRKDCTRFPFEFP